MIDIKPCPFCGSDNLLLNGYGWCYLDLYVKCNECGAHGPQETDECFGEKWNACPRQEKNDGN